MAFNLKGFTRVQAVGTVAATVYSVYSYHTADNAATVETSGYFNSVYNMLSVGDIIMCVSGIGGTLKLKEMVVTGVSSTATTVALSTTSTG